MICCPGKPFGEKTHCKTIKFACSSPKLVSPSVSGGRNDSVVSGGVNGDPDFSGKKIVLFPENPRDSAVLLGVFIIFPVSGC